MPPLRADNFPTLLCAGPCTSHSAAYADLLALHGSGPPLLTAAGLAHVQSVLGIIPVLPYWDAELRCLWLGPRLLREYQRPAHDQTTILAAFQRRGWVAKRIPDPLVLRERIRRCSAECRLRDTLKNLNRDLPPDTIRFRHDKNFKKVWWEISSGAAEKK